MIGIILPGTKKYTPYIQNYLNILDEKNTEYRVMSWDKQSLLENGIDMRFDYPVDDFDRKKMLFGYIRFINKCKSYIKKNKIDKLIILTAAPAFFLGVGFLRKFKGSFILDIRDDSPLVRRFPEQFKRICAMAETVVVSSNEFTPWTGRDTILCHNADLGQIHLHKNEQPIREFDTPIRIVFAGVMIEGHCNVDVLKEFYNDVRFKHTFIGRECTGKQIVQEYVSNSGMMNVSFEGAYNKEEIIDIYRSKADVINIFRANTTVNRNALPNKLYEAVLAGRPIVVFEHNVAIAKYCDKYDLGIVIPNNIKSGINNYVFDKTRTFNFCRYEEGRRAFLEKVETDMGLFIDAVGLFSMGR